MTLPAATRGFSPLRRRAGLLALSWAAGGCAAPAGSGTPAAANPADPAGDLRWLRRVLFHADGAALARLRRQGRAAFLDAQLAPAAPPPPALAEAIAAPGLSQQDGEARFRAARAEQQRIAALPDEAARQPARAQLRRAGDALVQETAARHLLRALGSPEQLREQMTWFWMNHFSVYAGKGAVRWTLPDYEDTLRERAFGRFGDLLLATVTAPAMLEYLDNAQSAAGRINENYARELMELHTLGVAGGPSGSRYTQQDVQELARVLTGVGIAANPEPPRLPPAQQALYLRQGLFAFDPRRHDAGAHTLLGTTIAPGGFEQVREAIALLAAQPATARFVCHKLATYFVADQPPPALVARMAARFAASGGDIAAVLRALFLAPEFDAALAAGPGKFKDPLHYVVSSLRLARAGLPLPDPRLAVQWLQQLGEPLYGRITPDGFSLQEAAWSGSGQMVRRFEIARAIGAGLAPLERAPDGTARRGGVPVLATADFTHLVAPTLGPATRQALADAANAAEWNTVLLASPEWMQR